MGLGFHAAAISRRDGGNADGIHLLFEAPASAGYSIDGFDIQRRPAFREQKIECVSLTAEELEALEEQLELSYEHGLIELGTAACPIPPRRHPERPGEPERTRTCVSFRKRKPSSVGPNPLELEGATFTVFDEPRRPAAKTELVKVAQASALDGGVALQVDLPEDAEFVELILCAKEGAVVQATAGERRLSRKLKAGPDAQTVELEANGLRRIRIAAGERGLALISCCWTSVVPDESGRARPDGQPMLSHLPAAMVSVAATAGGCLTYDFSFPLEHDRVAITFNVPMALAIAFRQGQAVATAAGDVSAEFIHRYADRVLVYTRARASLITVCADVPPSEEENDRSWSGAATIAKNVNFPVRAVNSALASAADERKLADTRLLPGETYDATAFEDATRVLGGAATVAPDVVPVWATTLTRADLDDEFVEVSSWAYATLPRLDAQWRRMLGLGHLDPGTGLTVGNAYDYRIIGRFRRRDVAERLLGFHTVPVGTALPSVFALDEVLLALPFERTVEMVPAAGSASVEVTGRKGIELEDAGFFGGCLQIELPAPVLRVALDVDPGHGLSYSAETSAALVGATPVKFSGPVPAKSHAVLDFTDPVDTIRLAGKGMFYGLRIGADPAADPDDVLTITQEIPGVVYESTPDPDPPALVGAENLQTPPVVAPTAGQPPPRPLGFHVSWLPPAAGGAVVWPPDLPAAPPFDVLSFGIERRRVDTGGAWGEMSADTAFFGSRGTQPDPLVLYPGQDLLSVFPEGRPPQPPVSPFMEAEDALERTGADPPPGSTHQYRVHSVDVIGRRSVPAASAVVRLEKHTPPPQPAGRQDTPPDTPAPAGVTARVLQASDPALPANDRTLLGTAATAVVIEWGWTDEQRTRDPYTKEFRLYWDSTPPDTIEGELTGTATPSGSTWTMGATMERSVGANAMAGRYIRAGVRPFLVVGNSAGTAVSVELARSAIEPALAPEPGSFVFQPALDGAELRPAGWERRSAVAPLTAADSYRHVFAETVTLDAAHPRARAWTGVSAADAESYVADELPAARPNGGRAGNESSIAAATAAASWIGRPAFTPSVPLPDVPEQRTNEPVGEDVRVRLDLPALLAGTAIPAGHLLLLERLPLADVVAALGTTAADAIHLGPPSGPAVDYTLANSADHAELLAQIGSGTPASVHRRFLMDALLRGLAGFEQSWTPAIDGHVAAASLELTLPAQAERYALRARIVDAAGHISADAKVLALVLRVPSLRTPAPPVLTVDADETDALAVSARARDAHDLHSVLFFSAPISGAAAPAAQLLRTPNRPDLYPQAGIRLRLGDGSLLSPTVVAASTGVRERPDRVVETTLTAGYEKQVAVWAATLTRDGVPSRLAGSSVAVTGPQPLAVPALAVTASGGEDRAAWSAPTVPAEAALERREGSGAWAQVSPWLPPAMTTYAIPGSGTRSYRLVLRAGRGRHATGPEVTPS